MTACHNPTIEDLLDDPITRAVMQADGVDPAELEALLRALASRRAGRSSDGVFDVACPPHDREAIARFLRSMGRGHTSRPVAARSSLQPQLCGTP